MVAADQSMDGSVGLNAAAVKLFKRSILFLAAATTTIHIIAAVSALQLHQWHKQCVSPIAPGHGLCLFCLLSKAEKERKESELMSVE
jgi:hypothetical protein